MQREQRRERSVRSGGRGQGGGGSGRAALNAEPCAKLGTRPKRQVVPARAGHRPQQQRQQPLRAFARHDDAECGKALLIVVGRRGCHRQYGGACAHATATRQRATRFTAYHRATCTASARPAARWVAAPFVRLRVQQLPAFQHHQRELHSRRHAHNCGTDHAHPIASLNRRLGLRRHHAQRPLRVQLAARCLPPAIEPPAAAPLEPARFIADKGAQRVAVDVGIEDDTKQLARLQPAAVRRVIAQPLCHHVGADDDGPVGRRCVEPLHEKQRACRRAREPPAHTAACPEWCERAMCRLRRRHTRQALECDGERLC
mmetsp:Transcript_20274/g.60284  ORF Transcript_20274/g.60284 Transcript_20274/m.60284 type:complete len:315 (-) Transcript_20274:336-1280(-)